MAVTIIDLITLIRVETGDEDSSNYKWTDAQYRDNKIPQGLRELSKRWVKEYGITGSGDSKTLDPTPDTEELEDVQTLIILCTAKATLIGERAAASRTAFVHSNPAGRTDFSRIPRSFTEAIDDLESRIKEMVDRKVHYRIEKELDEAGEELKSQKASDKTWVEGLPVTTITTEV